MFSPQEWRQGWPRLAGATGAVTMGAAMFAYTAGLFVAPIAEATGWSRSEIAFAATLNMLMNAAAMPFMGHLVDRFGVRRIGVPAMIVYAGLLVVLASIPPTLVLFYAAIMAMSIFYTGTSAITFAPVVVRYFNHSRGLALGIMMSGASLLLLPFAPVFAGFIDTNGWRAGYLVLAGAALFIGLPCAIFATRFEKESRAAQASVVQPGLTFTEAVRTGTFWQLVIALILPGIPLAGYLHQLPVMGEDRGMSAVEAGLLSSAYVFAVLGGRIGLGQLLDIFAPRRVAFAAMTISASGALLLFAFPDGKLAVMLPAAALLGMAMGAEGDMVAFFAARYFGRRAFATIFGSLVVATSISFAIGPTAFALMYEATGDYALVSVLSAVALIVSGVLFLTLRADAHWHETEQSAA